MDLLKYIIAPFEFIIREIYLFSYSITENYGISVILLSLVISLLLLPIFILIERSKKRDDAVKRRMKPQLEEIRRNYKGQERYYYIRTLHRQHGYNSFKSLVPVLSLLLQIPFFIAAYQFLEHFEPLAGQSFLFIKDLSEPDGLLGSINLLPIIMTLVNLVTAYFYTRNGDKAERKQMLVVAGVFLVLLYNFPSGLVLYWTMNNVFSFFRLFITHPEVFKKRETMSGDWKTGISGMTGGISGSQGGILEQTNGISSQQARIWGVIKATLKKKTVVLKVKFTHVLTFYAEQIRSQRSLFKIAFAVILILILASQLQWALQHNFDDFILRMVVAPAAALLLTMVIAAGYVIFMNFRDIVSNTPIKPILHLLLLFFATYFYFAAKLYFTDRNSALTIMAVLLTLPLQCLSLIYFIKTRNLINRFLFQAVSTLLLVLHLFQAINLLALLNNEMFSFHLLNTQFTIESPAWLAIVAAGIAVSIITVPLYLKSINIKQLQPPNHHWLLLFLSMLYIAGLIFFWNPMIVYASYPKNFEFPAVDFLTNNYGPFILVISFGLIVYLLTPRYLKPVYIKLILSIAFVFFLYSSIIPFDAGTLQVNLLSNEKNLAKPLTIYILEALLLLTVLYGTHRILESKQVKYVVIGLVLINLLLAGQSLYLAIDTGNFLTKEVVVSGGSGDENSEIPFSQEGENIVLFVIDGAQGWYMNDLIEEDSSLREVFSGFTYYPNTLAMANYTYASVPSIMCGYDYSIAGMNRNEEKTIIEKVTDATEQFYDKVKEREFDFTSTILRYSRIDRNKFDHYIPSWHDSWSEIQKLGNPEEMWYTRLWENALFSGVPLFLKPGIYNHTKWVMKEKSNLNLTELYPYHFVKLLPEISTINNQNPNFIYIHSLFTHNPWGLINEENQFIRDVTPFECQRSFTYTFADWIRWMKEAGIYDNTKIILVSDHGPSWWHFNGEITTTAPIVWTEEEKISLERFLHLNALLMVKDFNSEGPLRDDWRLMNTADVSAIAFNENDPTKSDSTSRTLPTFFTTWHTDLKTRIKFENKHAFKVKDYVYDLHNWESIE